MGIPVKPTSFDGLFSVHMTHCWNISGLVWWTSFQPNQLNSGPSVADGKLPMNEQPQLSTIFLIDNVLRSMYVNHVYIHTYMCIYIFPKDPACHLRCCFIFVHFRNQEVVEVETSWRLEVSSQRLCTSSSTLQPSLGDGQFSGRGIKVHGKIPQDLSDDDGLYDSLEVLFFLAVWSIFFWRANGFFCGSR